MSIRWTSAIHPHRVVLPFEPTVTIVGLPPYGIPANKKPQGHLRTFLQFYEQDTGFRVRSGDLRSWLDRFILMLDYHRLTFKALSKINYDYDGKVFILWGGKARKFSPVIDHSRHYLMTDQQGSFREAAEFLGKPLDFWRLY